MAGVNRYTPVSALAAKTLAANAHTNCIFISHRQADWQLAIQIAGVFGALDLDFWLDIEQLQASEPKTDAEHLQLAKSIEAGLESSTHLLALITPNTLGSMWVPFEIGCARTRRKPLAFLVHAEVASTPSYFVFGKKLADQDDLYKWARELSSRPQIAQLAAAKLLANTSNLDQAIPKYRHLP